MPMHHTLNRTIIQHTLQATSCRSFLLSKVKLAANEHPPLMYSKELPTRMCHRPQTAQNQFKLLLA